MFTLQGLLPADCAPSSAEVLQMVHPDDRSVVERAWQRMIEELRPVEYEYRIVKPDGGIVHMVTRGVVERDPTVRPGAPSAPPSMSPTCAGRSTNAMNSRAASSLWPTRSASASGSWSRS
jgi:PAS domain-containing protein